MERMEKSARRTSANSSNPSDWSDPSRDDASSSGIAIPAFLQPLLGIDFVPYLPSPVATTSATTSNVTQLSDEELAALDLFPSRLDHVPIDGQPSDQSGNAPRHPGLSLSRSRSLGAISSDPTILEALAPPATGEPSQEDAANSENQGNRRWRPSGGRLIHKVRGKIEERRVRKEQRRSRRGSWNGEGISPFKARPTRSSQNNEALDWIQEQNLRLANHQAHLEEVHLEAEATKARANTIYQRVGEAQNEILKLQKALVLTEHRLRRDLKELDDTKAQLSRLQMDALRASQALIESIQQMQGDSSSSPDTTTRADFRVFQSQTSDLSADSSLDNRPLGTETNELVQLEPSSAKPLRPRASTDPCVGRLDSFMRADDLDIPEEDLARERSLSVSGEPNKLSKPNGLIFVDNNITPILKNLCKLGYRIAVDESNRFKPTKDTERVLAKYKTTSLEDNRLDEWPVSPWNAPHGHDILVWTGDIGHTGFGSDWPVVKARCLIDTSPRELVEYMMDSSRIKEYNKLSQGRQDLVKIQEGLDTTEEMSLFGFAGDCKMVKALNKLKLLPTAIETLSLSYSKPLTSAPGSYMTVIRSVFEDNSGEHKSPAANTIRSEMLLGVLLFRPANADHSVCELTNVTHLFSPGVPEMLARRAAPSSAYNMMKDVQSIFSKRKR